MLSTERVQLDRRRHAFVRDVGLKEKRTHTKALAEAPAVPSPARSWRPLRLMIVATLVVEVLQFTFGEIVSASANYPATPVPINSISQLFSAISSAGGTILFVHAFTGLFLFLMVVGTLAIAVRYHRRNVTNSVALGVLSMLIAVLGGYVWASSDFSNGGGILLMVNGALAAYSFLFIALYYTRQAA